MIYHTPMNEMTLSKTLQNIPLGGLKFFDSTASTNDIALDWAGQGAPDFSLVCADHQSAGRGRLDRRWVTQAGTSLAFSLILRPTPAEREWFGLYAALGAAAAADALEYDLGLSPQIKWPNDVLLSRKKVGGILTEASWLGDQPQAVVIGIGLNIAPGSVPPADELRFPGGCVEEVLGRAIDRAWLLARILTRLPVQRARMGTPAFNADWERRLAFRGEWVRLDPCSSASPESIPEKEPLTGRVLGIDGQGSLRIETQSGKIWTATAGEVSLRPLQT